MYLYFATYSTNTQRIWQKRAELILSCFSFFFLFKRNFFFFCKTHFTCKLLNSLINFLQVLIYLFFCLTYFVTLILAIGVLRLLHYFLKFPLGFSTYVMRFKYVCYLILVLPFLPEQSINVVLPFVLCHQVQKPIVVLTFKYALILLSWAIVGFTIILFFCLNLGVKDSGVSSSQFEGFSVTASSTGSAKELKV